MEDEFVIFPNNSNQSNITIDVRLPGSHDPGRRGESGRQHRPTGADTALRYSGEKIMVTLKGQFVSHSSTP